MTYKFFLGLGSNVDPRFDYIKKACTELLSIGKIIKKSSIDSTQPWGDSKQADFYNAVIEFDTSFEPRALLNKIKAIEKKIGRSKTLHWGPREIDIDIIFCQNCVVSEPELYIPHRDFSARRFVLEPMAEINKNFFVTNTKKTVFDYLNECIDHSRIQKLSINW